MYTKKDIRKAAKAVKKDIEKKSEKINLESLTDYVCELGYSVKYDKSNLLPTNELVDFENQAIYITSKLNEKLAIELLAHALGHVILKHKTFFVDNITQENEANYFRDYLLGKHLHYLKFFLIGLSLGILISIPFVLIFIFCFFNSL